MSSRASSVRSTPAPSAFESCGCVGRHQVTDGDGLTQHLGGLLLHDGADEEVGVHPAVQPNRVREREVAEVVVGHEPFVDGLVRLFEHLAHVFHVEVADVGAEHRVEPRAERVELGVEAGGDHAVVAFAPEEEVRDEQLGDVLGDG